MTKLRELMEANAPPSEMAKLLGEHVVETARGEPKTITELMEAAGLPRGRVTADLDQTTWNGRFNRFFAYTYQQGP